MYICVLSSIAEDNDPPYDPSPHLEGRQWRHHVVQSTDVEMQIKTLMDDGVDVFLNLCDGTPDEPVSGVQLVKAMEKLGAAFTGADSSFFDPTRQEMKRAAARVGVPTPASTFVKSMADVERAARTLRFPMLVKPAHGYASFGIRKESRVTNVEDLKTQAAITMKDDGRALIEEFIEGREFTCLAAEDPDDQIQLGGGDVAHVPIVEKVMAGIGAQPATDAGFQPVGGGRVDDIRQGLNGRLEPVGRKIVQAFRPGFFEGLRFRHGSARRGRPGRQNAPSSQQPAEFDAGAEKE